MNLLRLLNLALSRYGEIVQGVTLFTPQMWDVQKWGVGFEEIQLVTQDPIHVRELLPRLRAQTVLLDCRNDPENGMAPSAEPVITPSILEKLTLLLTDKEDKKRVAGSGQLEPLSREAKRALVPTSNAEEGLKRLNLKPALGVVWTPFDLSAHQNLQELVSNVPCRWAQGLRILTLTLYEAHMPLFYKGVQLGGKEITSLHLIVHGVHELLWLGINHLSFQLTAFSFLGEASSKPKEYQSLSGISFPKLRTLHLEHAPLPQADWSLVAFVVYNPKALEARIPKKTHINCREIQWHEADVSQGPVLTKVQSAQLVLMADAEQVDRAGIRTFCPSARGIRFETDPRLVLTSDDPYAGNAKDPTITWVFPTGVSKNTKLCFASLTDSVQTILR